MMNRTNSFPNHECDSIHFSEMVFFWKSPKDDKYKNLKVVKRIEKKSKQLIKFLKMDQ